MLYPLQFKPVIRQAIWGGRKLATELGKPLGSEGNYAESWEVVDHHSAQSVVSNGPLAGITLRELMRKHGREILGDTAYARVNSTAFPDSLRGRFPLLLKFLDAQTPLSVQVHPDDPSARTMEPPDLGKTEAWYVLSAAEKSVIYAGLQEGVQVEDLRRAVLGNDWRSVLHSFVPRPGDCVFIPAGTVHAIGGEILLAEIQQASDTTFRLHDWGRVDSAGNPRELHVEQALSVIDYRRGPVKPVRVNPQAGSRQVLAACDKFILSHWRIDEPMMFATPPRMRIAAVISGCLQCSADFLPATLKRGDCILFPATTGRVQWSPVGSAELLMMELPDRESFHAPSRGE